MQEVDKINRYKFLNRIYYFIVVKEELVLWITGFIVLGLVLVFIIRDKNRDVPLEEYEYIKNIKVQLEDIKNLLAECNKQPIACKKR